MLLARDASGVLDSPGPSVRMRRGVGEGGRRLVVLSLRLVRLLLARRTAADAAGAAVLAKERVVGIVAL